jgi:DME family drug/metabolite transporter
VVAVRDRAELTRWRVLLDRPVLGWLVVAAASTAAYQAAFLTSVVRTGAALSTVVALGVAPPAVGVLARLLGLERLTRAWVLGTGAAVLGTALLLLPAGAVQIDTLGVLLGVLGGICYGVYTVAAKRLLDGAAPTFVAVAATLVVGGAIVLPFAHDAVRIVTEPNSLALAAWLAVPATTVAYLLFVAGLRHVTAATAGTLSLAEPLVAAVLGVALLGERLPLPVVVGTGLLLAGMALAVVRPRSSPTTAVPRRAAANRRSRSGSGRRRGAWRGEAVDHQVDLATRECFPVVGARQWSGQQ